MSQTPDLTDPRYVDEIGWFIYHEKYRRDQFGGSYDSERIQYSRLLLEEITGIFRWNADAMEGKTVVTIGCGCTGDLAAFPAATKVAIDPLLNIYRKLGMLLDDIVGARTVYLSVSAESLPLLDDYADLVICRNALDHMPEPEIALREFSRILKPNGSLFVSVDIGGEPTPDEPTVFTVQSLRRLLEAYFVISSFNDKETPHSEGRVCSVRMSGQKIARETPQLDKDALLRAYEARLV